MFKINFNQQLLLAVICIACCACSFTLVYGAQRNFKANVYGHFNLYSNWEEYWVPNENDTVLIPGPNSVVESDSYVNTYQRLDIGSPVSPSNNVSLRISTNAQMNPRVGIFVNNNASFIVNGSTITGPVTIQPYGKLTLQSWASWYVYNNFKTLTVNQYATSSICEFTKIQQYINYGDSTFRGSKIFVDNLQNYQPTTSSLYSSWITFDSAQPTFINFNSAGGSIDFIDSVSSLNYTLISLTNVGSYNSVFNLIAAGTTLITNSTLDLDYSTINNTNSAVNNVDSTFYLLSSKIVSNGGSFYLVNSNIVALGGSKLSFTNTDLQIRYSTILLDNNSQFSSNKNISTQGNFTIADRSSVQMSGYTWSHSGLIEADDYATINGSLNVKSDCKLSLDVKNSTHYSELSVTQLATLSGSIDINVQPNAYNGVISLIYFGQPPVVSSSLAVNIVSCNPQFQSALQSCATYKFSTYDLSVNFTNCLPPASTTTTTSTSTPITTTITTTTTGCGCTDSTSSTSSTTGTGSSTTGPSTTVTTTTSTNNNINVQILL